MRLVPWAQHDIHRPLSLPSLPPTHERTHTRTPASLGHVSPVSANQKLGIKIFSLLFLRNEREASAEPPPPPPPPPPPRKGREGEGEDVDGGGGAPERQSAEGKEREREGEAPSGVSCLGRRVARSEKEGRVPRRATTPTVGSARQKGRLTNARFGEGGGRVGSGLAICSG